jgi:hypothetical protein
MLLCRRGNRPQHKTTRAAALRHALLVNKAKPCVNHTYLVEGAAGEPLWHFLDANCRNVCSGGCQQFHAERSGAVECYRGPYQGTAGNTHRPRWSSRILLRPASDAEANAMRKFKHYRAAKARRSWLEPTDSYWSESRTYDYENRSGGQWTHRGYTCTQAVCGHTNFARSCPSTNKACASSLIVDCREEVAIRTKTAR